MIKNGHIFIDSRDLGAGAHFDSIVMALINFAKDKQGKYYTIFYGYKKEHELYSSEIKCLDDAYLKVFGKTKKQYDEDILVH